MAKRPIEFWQKLAQDAGLDEPTQKALLSSVQNEKFEKALYDSLVPREESMSQLNEAQRIKSEAETEKSKYIAAYTENLKWYQTAEAKLKDYDRIAAAMNGRDPGAGNDPDPAVNGKGASAYTREDVEKLVNDRQRGMWTLQRQLRRAEQRYLETFGKSMPDTMLDELEQLATKPENANRSLTDIFTEHITPKVDELRTTQSKEREEKIRKEAFEAGLAKGRMREPSDGVSPADTSPLYLGRPKKEELPTEPKLMQNFMETLDQPAGVNPSQ